MAESILNECGEGRYIGLSAGSRPTGTPHPMAVQILSEQGSDVSALRSKSWEEFALPGAPAVQFVFTVCDNARGESCPIWPGTPLTAHWGVEDPAAFQGSDAEQRQCFRRIYEELEHRILAFLKLDIEALDKSVLKQEIEAIGKEAPSGRFGSESGRVER